MQTESTATADMAATDADFIDSAPEDLMEEVRVGFEELCKLNHTELRNVISDRVRMLQTELTEREARREAIDTAQMANKLLESRRERAIRIQRQVNMGSAFAAVASTFLIVAVMV